MRFFLSVSVLFLILLPACSPKLSSVAGFGEEVPFWNEQLRDSTQKNSYRIEVNVGKANISGILIVKKIDNAWKGTLMNEFGVKIFDFSSNEGKYKLIHVMAMIDKWYIRRTIAGDIQFMLEIDNPAYKKGRTACRRWNEGALIVSYGNEKEFSRFPDGELVMKNKKRNIIYSLRLIEE